MINTIVFESPDMFTEFGGVSALLRNSWHAYIKFSFITTIIMYIRLYISDGKVYFY